MSPLSSRALLRRFEPIMRYTRHERFYPLDVDSYIRSCSLWIQHPGGRPSMLVPEGKLTPEKLAEHRSYGFGTVAFLKFIDPVSPTQLASYRLKHVREKTEDQKLPERFRTETGRLARVGYLSRLVDAIFSVSLLVRGRITGDTAMAAAFAYQSIMSRGGRYAYYGRVVQQGGWRVLQYWFFYPFNNWRSGFFGLNDHEADWEMISLYLWEDSRGMVKPEWVAYSSHDYPGEELRRHWDDPELVRVGDHPVIFVGAGSHSNYFVPGEYITEVELGFLSHIGRATDRLHNLWRILVRQPRESRPRRSRQFLFRVPFIDYAHGDGLSIGPGQEVPWGEPGLLNPAPGWALHYRGLWGYYAQDPAAGENAPAGPIYNRDGTVRSAWYDPVGWAGLQKVALPTEVLPRARERREEIERESAELRRGVQEKSREILSQGMDSMAMKGNPHLEGAYAENETRMERLASELGSMRGQLAQNNALVEAMDLFIRRIEAGEPTPMRAHLRRPLRPTSDIELRLSRLAEMWAAISIGLAMVGVIALFLFAREHLWKGLGALAGLIVTVEAGFRRYLQQLVSTVTITLAAVSASIVLVEFLREIAILSVLLLSGYILVQNIRELIRW